MKYLWFKKEEKVKKGSFDEGRDQDLMVALKEAHEEVLALRAKVGEYEWLEEALRKRTRELNERMKELHCLYTISACLTKRELTLEQKFDLVVKEMPRGWQYPKATCVRLIFKNQEYTSPNFRQTQPKQSAVIYADGKQVGLLEVFLLPQLNHNGKQLFLNEEQELLNAVALWIGEIVSHKK
jgi:nitrate/nitrite-specific signal transduction histidine kinase